MSGNKIDINYRPSQNVRKGYVGSGGGGGGNSCRGTPPPIGRSGAPPGQATGLPLDRTWPYLGGRMGAGNWDFSTYWQVNHSGDGRSPPTVNGAPASNSNPPSRYDVYRYEIDQGYVADRSPGGESGAPACYSGGELSGQPDTAHSSCRRGQLPNPRPQRRSPLGHSRRGVRQVLPDLAVVAGPDRPLRRTRRSREAGGWSEFRHGSVVPVTWQSGRTSMFMPKLQFPERFPFLRNRKAALAYCFDAFSTATGSSFRREML